MGRGRNRKPRNFATFRLCPRPGAADASDRVFVRVDDNSYTVPGFDDAEGPSSSAAAGGDGDLSFSSSAEDGGGALPEHVRREILELGLPDDGYDYLSHLRELRPSLSPFGGGGSSAVFLPSRRPARSGLRADVKAYDLTRAPAGSGEVAVVAASRVEAAIDLDVAKLLDGSDLSAVESGDEDLEEDFVLLANQSDEEQKVEEEGVAGGEEKSLQLPREHFVSLALEGCVDGGHDCHVRDEEHELSEEVINELKLPHRENCDAEEKHRAPQSSDVSGFTYSTTMVSGSYLDVEKEFPKFPPGETSMKKTIIRKEMEKLPAGYLPQRKTSSGETPKQGPYKERKVGGKGS